jgi:hypothetical protein
MTPLILILKPILSYLLLIVGILDLMIVGFLMIVAAEYIGKLIEVANKELSK